MEPNGSDKMETDSGGASDAANSKLNEDLIEVQISLTDTGGISQDWLKLKPNFSHIFLDNEKFPEDDQSETVNGKNLSEDLMNTMRPCENLEYQILNLSHDLDNENDKVYTFQDLLKNDCGDISSFCKNFRDNGNLVGDNNTRQIFKNQKSEKVYSQDVLLSNVQEWLLNVASDKKNSYLPSNSTIEPNDVIAAIESNGNFDVGQSSSIFKTPVTNNLQTDLNKIDISKIKTITDSKANLSYDSYIEGNHKFINVTALNFADLMQIDKTSSTIDSYKVEDLNNFNQNRILWNKIANNKVRNLYMTETVKDQNANSSSIASDHINLPDPNDISHNLDKNVHNLTMESVNARDKNEEVLFKDINTNIFLNPDKANANKDSLINEPIETNENSMGISEKPVSAMVTFTQDYSAGFIKVTIASSNKKQTIFKVFTKDVVKAVLSIKESSLAILGLKSDQMLQIANEASRQLEENLALVAEKINILSDKSIKFPNISVSTYINEDLSLAEIPVANADINILKTNRDKKCNFMQDNKDHDIEKNHSQDKYKFEKPRRRRNLKDSNTKLSSLANNVSFSLLPGSSPTMVARPSVLDSLSVSSESKKNLVDSLGISQLNKKMVGNKLQFMAVSENKVLKLLEELGITLESLEFHSGPHKTKSWKCPVNSCPKFFTKLSKLKVHILSHDGIRPYKCSYENCDWAFCTSYKLKRHLETHLKRKDFACSEILCDKKFTTIYNLNAHMQQHQKPKGWLCSHPNCDISFHTQKELEKHMYNHDSHMHPYKCNVNGCGKGFVTPNSLALHSRSHHNDEDLQCKWEGCGKKFDKPCRLKIHMRIHTGQRPYACRFDGCNSKFYCASKLSRHQKKHTNDRKYTCTICKKAFLRPEHLKEHLLTHTGVRNFQCPFANCGSKFTAKSSLYVHIKKHKIPKNAIKSGTSDTNNPKGSHDQNHANHFSYISSDCQQMDYITLIGDKEFSPDTSAQSSAPLCFQHDPVIRSHDKNFPSGILAPQDTVLMQFLDVSNGLPLEPPESTIALSVSDSLFPPTMTLSEDQSHLAVDLGFLDVQQKDPREATDSKKKTSSNRADILSSIIMSQKAKQRGYSRHPEDSQLKAVFSTSDVILSDMVNDAAKLQGTVLQDESTNVFYPDSLITQDILNYPTQQSTINLRDLE